MPETRFQGVGVSPGLALGAIHVIRDDSDEVARRRIQAGEIPNEIGRFETALIQTRAQILEMQERIAESIGAKDAGIFDAHLLVVEDRTLIDEVLRKLETDFPGVEFNFPQYLQDNVAEAVSGVKGENSIKLFGNDLQALTDTANKIKAVLATEHGIAAGTRQ